MIVTKCSECPFVQEMPKEAQFQEEGDLVHLWCCLDIFEPFDPRAPFGYVSDGIICRFVEAVNEGKVKDVTFARFQGYLIEKRRWLKPEGLKNPILNAVDEWNAFVATRKVKA